MVEPMDEAPQTRLALGPIEISLRRRGDDDVRRIGVPGSILVHVAVVLLLLILTPYRRIPHEAEAVLAAQPPLPITFVNPFPPPAPTRPVPEIQKPPPPPAAKALRMQEPPQEPIAPQARAPVKEFVREVGRNDTKPAGGESGGPLPEPTAGFPESDSASASSAAEPSKDLQGRLREFRRALETPVPPGSKGGGKGTGGLTMPDVPATGMGIGNLEFESRDYDWSSYARSIYWAIWRAWHNRLLASSGNFERWAAEHERWMIDARSRIVFTIERSGQISGVAVETPSGCYPFDDSATDALREVLLPPLPSDFPREQERIHATFIGEDINIRSMRTGLQWLKDRGVF